MDFNILICLIKDKDYLSTAFKAITIKVASKEFKIEPYHLIKQCFRVKENRKHIICFTNLSMSKLNKQVLGVPFFLRNYVVFDMDNKRIGLYSKTKENLKRERKRKAQYPIDVSKYGNVTNVYGHLMAIGDKHDLTLTQLSKDDDASAESTIYILIGIDVLLLSIIAHFVWKKRFVFATREWYELLDI